MKFGFPLPTRGPLAKPESMGLIARRGEELGFEFVSVSDHVVIPRSIRSDYPYNEKGQYPGTLFGSTDVEYLDQLTVMAFVAARTRTIRLLTSVMVVPYRPAVHTAKALASIDVLSKGRLILGAGAGWMREEFEALGAPSFERRGAVTEEYLRAFVELWTEDHPEFAGNWVSFSGISSRPKPIQRPHPPIWMGGESGPALRRTARLANGWYPFAHPRPPAIGSVDGLSESLSRLRDLTEAEGRDPDAMDVILDAEMMFHPGRKVLAADGSRQMFTGSVDAVASDIGRFEEAGVRQIQVLFRGESVSEITEGMERFSQEQMAGGRFRPDSACRSNLWQSQAVRASDDQGYGP